MLVWRLMTRARWLAAVLFVAGSLAALGSAYAAETAAEKPLPPAVEASIILHSIAPEAPIYLRVFKEESELEVWKARPNGRYALIKTFPVCNWGGTIGPKQSRGDRMSPEGFYNITPSALKPDSKYHLAFNIGYPNALDRSLGRTGNFIMVHGNCVSVGCFAMSDTLIEEIYAFVRELAGCRTNIDPDPRLPVPHDGGEHETVCGQPGARHMGTVERSLRRFLRNARATEDRHVRQTLRGQFAHPGRHEPGSGVPGVDW